MPDSSLPSQSTSGCSTCGAGPDEMCDFDCGLGERPGRWEYRSTCNGDPTPADEGWTDDPTIAEDEAELLKVALGKRGVRIERRWSTDA